MQLLRRLEYCGVAASVLAIGSWAAAQTPAVPETNKPPSEWIRALEGGMPAWALNELLSVKVWQWVGLFSLILIGLLLDQVIRFGLAVVARRVMARHGGEATSDTIRKTMRPFGLFVAGVFWLIALRMLGLPDLAESVLFTAARVFVTFAGVWLAYRLADLLSEFFASKAAETETKIDDLLVPLIRKAVKVFITAFGIVYIADSLNVQIAPLLAGLGIGGIGFAFAARDTLENLFGSVTVIADRPFRVGEWVQIGDVEGTVQELGFRSTRVRTFYNSVVTIPNGNLVRAIVDNYGQRRYRRWKTNVSILYSTAPDKIEVFCEGIRELIRVHPYTRKDFYQVWLNQFGPSSLDVLVYMFFETPDWTTELRERHRLMMDIVRLADRLGIEFAFPTQTLHLYQESHDQARSPAPAPGKGADQAAARQGREVVHELTAAAQWRAGKPEPYVFTAASPPLESKQKRPEKT